DEMRREGAVRSPHQVRKELSPRGYALTERLCAYPQYLDPEWLEQGVLDLVKLKYWSFIPRRGSGRRQESPPPPDVAPRAIERGRRGEELTDEELTALFSETRPEVIEEMRRAPHGPRGGRARGAAALVGEPHTTITNHRRARRP